MSASDRPSTSKRGEAATELDDEKKSAVSSPLGVSKDSTQWCDPPKKITIRTVQDGKIKEEEIDRDKLEAKCEFEWKEEITGPKDWNFRRVYNNPVVAKNFKNYLVENNHQNDLGLIDSSPHPFGFRLYARKDFKQGDIIGFYAAEALADSAAAKDKNFLMSAAGFGSERVLDARYKGNFMRFASHAPVPEHLKQEKLVGQNLSDIGTVNADQKQVIHNGYICAVFTANRDIKAGEEIFIFYNADYFKNKPMCIFSKSTYQPLALVKHGRYGTLELATAVDEKKDFPSQAQAALFTLAPTSSSQSEPLPSSSVQQSISDQKQKLDRS